MISPTGMSAWMVSFGCMESDGAGPGLASQSEFHSFQALRIMKTLETFLVAVVKQWGA